MTGWELLERSSSQPGQSSSKGAKGGTRTPTDLRPQAPEACKSSEITRCSTYTSSQEQEFPEQPRKLGVVTSSRRAPRFGAQNPAWRGGVSANKVRYRERFQARYPEKAAAHLAVKKALRSGRLVRQPCEVCGEAEVHAHHDSYEPARQLDVRWLCRPHHRAWHDAHGSPMGRKPKQPPPAAPFVWRGKLRTPGTVRR